MKVLIFGASGSGTTTLGKELGRRTGYTHLDIDEYYWIPTKPPFQEKVSLPERNKTLTRDFEKFKNVIVSGSLVSWGESWQNAFDLAIFIYLNPTVRIERLKKRELERYGNKLLTDKLTQQNSEEFIEWAKKYDDQHFSGRSLTIHNQWIKFLNCPVVRIDGEISLNDKTEKILTEINYLDTEHRKIKP